MPAPTDATELLRHIEHRTASMWEAASHDEPSSPLTDTGRDRPFGRHSVSLAATIEKDPAAGEPSTDVAAEDNFSHFQSLPISAVPQIASYA